MIASSNGSHLSRVQTHVLTNGLTVWLDEDHSQPKVFGAVVVRAGAKDTPNTGIAHYFEHLMFKGTDKIGTVDYAAEKVWLDRIASAYDMLAETEDPKRRAHLRQVINELSARAATYVIPNEFDRLIARYGGSRLNAGTSYDYTVYFNTFSPSYIAQWAEINSERLVNPVFRLFQSEMETVYEEKNQQDDVIANAAVERLIARYFQPHPYAYPIIGSAENLRNPRLSDLRDFFETYYVASNMGLILSGDLDPAEVIPLLERTFSRIRRGEPPHREVVPPPPFKGREKATVRIPLTFVKVMAMGFRGVPVAHPDEVPLTVAVSLLNNSNGTGFLDQLTVEHKVMGAMVVQQGMNEAGVLGVIVFPKLFFQSYAAAEKLIWNVIDRIKSGDFSDELLQSVKLELKREQMSQLEDIQSRAERMMRVFSTGHTWQEYLDEAARLDSVTREEVMAVTAKYFTENYLYVTKKTGHYPKENLPKPEYAPIQPGNLDAASAYSEQLASLPVRESRPLFLDFSKDAEIVPLRPLISLYRTDNTVNEIFSLTLDFGVGELEQRDLEKVVAYLPFVATKEMPFEAFRTRLQELGSTLTFDSTDQAFRVVVNGFDSHLDETLVLVGKFLRHAEPDNKKLRSIIDEAKVVEKSIFSDSETVADMMLERMRFGDQSRFLTKLKLSEIKKLTAKDLLDTFHKVRTVACDLHYCGSLPTSTVVEAIQRHLPLEDVTVPSRYPFVRELRTYDKPTVFFLDQADVSQSILLAYMRLEPMEREETYMARLFNAYFGGDMSSILFQEIREFRSLAYHVSAGIRLAPLNRPDLPASFTIRMGTRTDKLIEAMEVLEGLIRELPRRPERLKAVKGSIRNLVNNEYPTPRAISLKIAGYQHEGCVEDPNKTYIASIKDKDITDIMRFHEKYIRRGIVTYAIVGNAKSLDLDKLTRFGEIIKLTKKDIYK